MGSDLVVALGRATVDGITLFGHNCSRPLNEAVFLTRKLGREFAPGEMVQTQFVQIPQARHTLTVVGCQSSNCWGYHQGLNEHGVAMGFAGFRNKLRSGGAGLTASDLVRLVLERGRTARQAVEILADLIERYGQSSTNTSEEAESDHGFLVADGKDAFLVETAAKHWAYQEILEVRAVSNVSTIRQDWNRISSGLAGFAIAQGWWPADGSKLDFADALSQSPIGEESALRRWGRATLLLEMQNGHIDCPFIRRVLTDHYEGTHFEVEPFGSQEGPLPLCQHERADGGPVTTVSGIAQLTADPERLPIFYFALGQPCLSVYFPIFLDGSLPLEFSASARGDGDELPTRLRRLQNLLAANTPRAREFRDRLSRLQVDFDQQAEELSRNAAKLKKAGEWYQLQHAATATMQCHLEQFEAALAALTEPDAAATARFHAVGSHD